jgi:hypothetical protein
MSSLQECFRTGAMIVGRVGPYAKVEHLEDGSLLLTMSFILSEGHVDRADAKGDRLGWEQVFACDGATEQSAEPAGSCCVSPSSWLFPSDDTAGTTGDGLEPAGATACATIETPSASRGRRHGAVATFTVEKLDEIRGHLEGLPPIEDSERTFNKQAAVRLLAGEIANLQQRGYTLEQIAQFMTGAGVKIGTATLKSYLSRNKNRVKRGMRKRPKRIAAIRLAPRCQDEAPLDAERVDGTGSVGDAVAGDRAGSASLHR